ncbi:zinc finger protein 2 homolog [Kryptolebias marmoratus]|uniref:zinc finger protein 2 homolog n=1 Tax=Kryptolebias marmoratus TaxID=37003 RepID=UPI0007F90EC0|nr:zinc finger protein 2 homolog [Kryptolebias marmoratus]
MAFKRKPAVIIHVKQPEHEASAVSSGGSSLLVEENADRQKLRAAMTPRDRLKAAEEDKLSRLNENVRHGKLPAGVYNSKARHDRLDVQQMLPIKEETPEEWRPGVDPVHIKEEEEGLWTSLEGENKDASDEWRPGVDPLLIKEEEELWSSLQGEQLSGRKEAGATRFALGASPLKSEDDEEKSPFSQLHQRQMKEEDFASCSSADRIKAATGGEDCGEAETSRNPNLKTSEDDSNSVETEVSDDDDEEDDDVNNPDYWLMHVTDSGAKAKGSDDDWKASRTPESGVNAGDASFSSSEGDKQFNSWTLPGRETSQTGLLSSGRFVQKKCFRVKHNVDSQGKVHKVFSCNNCEKTFSRKTDLKTHVETHVGEKPFVCGVCRQRFTRKTTLDIHARIHTGEKPFGCDFCGQRFTQKSTLITHMRIHTGQKPFECVVCGRGLSRRTHLNKHMRIHTGQKPFGCDVCGQRFICKKTLETHRRIHTGDEPFVCEVCGQTFTQQGSLITHRRIHTGQKPFHCDVCGQMFSRKTNLNTHMRIHTGEKPFGCDVCGQRFNQKPTLVAHKRTHTGEKPFACEVCGQRFSRKTNLNTHVRSHTGEKLACAVCGEAFNQKARLNRHMRIHTGWKII